MFTHKVKFTDFNGNEREKTLLFHFSKAELAEMQMSKEGGLQTYVTRIVEAQNTPEIAALFKDLVLKSYGEKSDDGMRFIKKDPVRGKLADEFEQTEAYSEFFVWLLSDEKNASAFVNGVLPADVQEEARKAQANGGHAYPASIAQKK